MSQSNIPDDRSIVPVETKTEPEPDENPLLTYAKQNPLMVLVIVLIIFGLLYFFLKKGKNHVAITVDSIVEDS
jgi:hypothetical protein